MNTRQFSKQSSQQPNRRRDVNYSILMFICLATQVSTSSALAQTPCEGNNFRQFDKLLGEWERYKIEGDEQMPVGKLSTQLVADGCALRQIYQASNDRANSQINGIASFETLAYLNKQGRWQEVYVYSDGRKVKHYLWEQNEEEFIIEEFGNASVDKQRWVITDLREDQYLLVDERSTDRGQTWRQQEQTKLIRSSTTPVIPVKQVVRSSF